VGSAAGASGDITEIATAREKVKALANVKCCIINPIRGKKRKAH
jgi:hypothetical protein